MMEGHAAKHSRLIPAEKDDDPARQLTLTRIFRKFPEKTQFIVIWQRILESMDLNISDSAPGE